MVRGAECDRAVLIMAARTPRSAGDHPGHDAAAGAKARDFSYQVTKDRTVFVFWHGRRVMTVTGRDAEKLLARLERIDADAEQMVLAKLTGNFKRGNERR